MFKKINALILSLAMAAFYVTVFSAPITASAQEAEPDRLSYALQIVNRKDADKTVTRGDAAGIVARLLGYKDDMMESGDVFADVSESNENAKAIYTAHKLGIISGTEQSVFEPSANVTWEQLAKMIVVGLGYGERAEHYGGFPSGYLLVASELKLDKNVTIENREKITGRTAAQIAENALKATVHPYTNIVYNPHVSLLYQMFRLEKYSGVVTGVPAASYTPNSYAENENDVYINDVRYLKGDSSVADMIGYGIDFYVVDDQSDPQTVVFAEKRRHREQIIDLENIKKVSVDRKSISIEYYASESARRAVTAQLTFENTGLIYNGMYTDITKTEEDFLDFSDGSVKLIDYNDDGKWDFIVVERITTARVKTYSNTTKTLTFEYDVEIGGRMTNSLDLTSYDIVTFDDNLSFATLKVGDVLEIRLPKNDTFAQKVIYINADNRVIREELSQIKTKDGKTCITAGGQDYEFSDDYAAFAKEMLSSLQLGVEYTMYLTKSGKIAYVTPHMEEERVYGYLVGLAQGLFDSVTMRVYMDDGKFHVLELADRVQVYRDGVYEGSKSPLKATEDLFIGGSFDKSKAQLIRFMPDRNAKVSVIEFAQNPVGSDEAIESYKEGKFVMSRSKFNGTYYHISRIVYGDKGPEFPLPSTSICFTVPTNPDELNDEKNFSVVGYSGQRSSVMMDTYNEDAMGIPGIVVKYSGVDKYQDFTVNSPIVVVSEISNCIDENGEPCEMLTDASGNKYLAKKEDNIFRDQTTGEALKPGDVVQIGTTKAGYVQFVELVFFTDPSAPNGYGYPYSDPTGHARDLSTNIISSGAFDAERITVSGYVADINDAFIKIRNAAGDTAYFKCDGDWHPLYTVYTGRDNIVSEKIGQINIGDFVVFRCTFSDTQEFIRYIK